jgi:hypothetical protein
MLSDDQLKVVWDRYRKQMRSESNRGWYQEWTRRYHEHVRAVQDTTIRELAKPHWQERLWTDRSITGAGPGDHIDVRALYDDQSVVQPIASLRRVQSRRRRSGYDPQRSSSASLLHCCLVN